MDGFGVDGLGVDGVGFDGGVGWCLDVDVGWCMRWGGEAGKEVGR